MNGNSEKLGRKGNIIILYKITSGFVFFVLLRLDSSSSPFIHYFPGKDKKNEKFIENQIIEEMAILLWKILSNYYFKEKHKFSFFPSILLVLGWKSVGEQ